MYKIKKDIDLNILKNYGMIYNAGSQVYVDNETYEFIVIDAYNDKREVFINIHIEPPLFDKDLKIYNNALNILYNLIKDNIIENVDN